jgi:hypothetical protein
MPATNVPQLPHSGFPQVKIQLCPLMAEMVDEAFNRPIPVSTCCYESPESTPGSCDGGYPCGDPTTSVIDGQAFCTAHGRTVSRG